MKADPFAQLRLLDVQEIDSQLDQIEHRLRSLPERAQEQEAAHRATALHNRQRDLQIEVSDLTAEQRKADADVEQVRARRERDRARMDSGQVANPKDLERMQHEMESLERRIASLEDDELEVMERLETAQRNLDEVVAERQQAIDAATVAHDAAQQREGELVAEREERRRERDQTASGIPTDLMALYERLRLGQGGVGAAALRARQCGGCRLTLDSAELAQIKAAPSDEVVRCEECSRILVRTAESGL